MDVSQRDLEGELKVDGNWKVRFVGACKVQMPLCKLVSESAFGLPNIEKLTSGATDTVDEELEQFINFANTYHHDLKFTWTISDTSLPFLDLSISISGN
eukprot:g26354.t1